MKGKVLITGGCGFIGCNAAKRALDQGCQVLLVDDLSRKGSQHNLTWLKNSGKKIKFHNLDIRNFKRLKKLFKAHPDFDTLLHFAGQVAVTTSIIDPRSDFEINACGTFNLLECWRVYNPKAVFLFSSTNKVYGGMENVRVAEKKNRYRFVDFSDGIDETFPLDFHSPYGCSKGTADQYVRDFGRIYGLKAVVFRQSCIYGEQQLGVEDQGWLAHFVIQTLLGNGLLLYGNGKQVRDVLYIGDLLDAFDMALEKIKTVQGEIFNVGGGKENQISLLELISYLEKELDKKIKVQFKAPRAGDQKIFVSNNSKAINRLRWSPKMDWRSGTRLMIQWVQRNRALIEKFAQKK